MQLPKESFNLPPNSAEPWRNEQFVHVDLGHCYLHVGRFTEALHVFDRKPSRVPRYKTRRLGLQPGTLFKSRICTRLGPLPLLPTYPSTCRTMIGIGARIAPGPLPHHLAYLACGSALGGRLLEASLIQISNRLTTPNRLSKSSDKAM